MPGLHAVGRLAARCHGYGHRAGGRARALHPVAQVHLTHLGPAPRSGWIAELRVAGPSSAYTDRSCPGRFSAMPAVASERATEEASNGAVPAPDRKAAGP